MANLEELQAEIEARKQVESQGFTVEDVKQELANRRMEDYRTANPKMSKLLENLPEITGLGTAITAPPLSFLLAPATTGLAEFIKKRKVGEITGQPPSPQEMATDVGEQAATGLVSELGGAALTGLIGKVGRGAKKSASEQAMHSLGPTQAMIKEQIKKKGSDVHELGQYALEKGLIDSTGDASVMYNKAKDIQSTVGEQIGRISKQADDALKTMPNNSLSDLIRYEGVVPEHDAQILWQKFQKEFSGAAGGDQTLASLKKELENILTNDQFVPIDKAIQMRKSYADLIDWSKTMNELPGVQKGYRMIHEQLNKSILKQIELMERHGVLDQGTMKALKNLNSEYSKISKIVPMAERQAARQISNQTIPAIAAKAPGFLVGGSVLGADVLFGDPNKDFISKLGTALTVGGATMAVGWLTKKLGSNLGARFMNSVANKIEAVPDRMKKPIFQNIMYSTFKDSVSMEELNQLFDSMQSEGVETQESLGQRKEESALQQRAKRAF